MNDVTPLYWRWLVLEDFPPALLYRYLQLRQAVFVLEQHCLYADLDDHDQAAQHLLGCCADGTIAACLRLLPPGEKYPEPSLGRVIVAPALRGTGLGHALVAEGLRQSLALYPHLPNRIQAQAHLARFYAAHGFEAFSAPYDEDGIAHVDMRLAAPPPAALSPARC